MARINFFVEDINFKLPNVRKTSSWIKATIQKEQKELNQLNYIFCSDEYLSHMNCQFLNHNTYTDIITFDTSEESSVISGDIFISVDRVKENALKFNSDFFDELHRVIIHGVLHLVGYSDKTLKSKREMRKKEDAYLSLRSI